MRSDTDPFWHHGLGFGPVRSRSQRLAFPWESGTFGFLSPQPSALQSSLEGLLRLPVPVPVPKQCSSVSAPVAAVLAGAAASGVFRAP